MKTHRKLIPTVMYWRSLLVSCLVVGMGVPSLAFDCQAKAQAFLGHPNKSGLTGMTASDREECWAIIGSSNLDLGRLNQQVGRGNRWAAQYLAEHVNKLDGGNLEDSLVALGLFSELRMKDLFQYAHRGVLSKRELVDGLTMLPLSLSDNPRAQLKALRTRRAKAKMVSKSEFSEQRADAIAAIDKAISEVKSHYPDEQ